MQSRELSWGTASVLVAAAITVNLSFAGCAAKDDGADNNLSKSRSIVTPATTTAGCGGGVCGDGTVDPGEQCDPPNGTSCSETCQTILATCGDCVVGPGEQCDPPNQTTCSATCQTIVVATCGDGVVNQPSEQCEPASTPAGNFTPACSATCEVGPSLCATCEASKCDAFFGFPGAWGCAGLTGSDRTNCEALVTCIRDTHCAAATSDAQACYCGTATDIGCLSGAGDGACKAQYEAAAGTTDAPTIAENFTFPGSPVGLANNQITCDADTADAQTCTNVCPL